MTRFFSRAAMLAAPTLALGLTLGAPAAAVEVSGPPAAAVETLGALPLKQERIGAPGGAFRTLRVTLAPGQSATLAGGAGEAAVVFVERGAVAGPSGALHAGQIAPLHGAATLTLRNDGAAAAVLLIADLVGAAR